MRSSSFPSRAILVFIVMIAKAVSAGVIYNDQGSFEGAALNLVEEDFDNFPVNENGFGSFSNGQTFGILSLTSLTFDTDIDLLDISLNDTGLDGTFLVDRDAGGNNVRPGGQGAANTDRDDDDFRITFRNPVSATGVFIIDNRIDASDQPESITFYDIGGTPLAAAALPGDMSGSGGDGFIGLVQDPNGTFISYIDIDEGRVLNDDIILDRILYSPEPSLLISFALSTIYIFGCLRQR